jgi:hypothetical protein
MDFSDMLGFIKPLAPFIVGGFGTFMLWLWNRAAVRKAEAEGRAQGRYEATVASVDAHRALQAKLDAITNTPREDAQGAKLDAVPTPTRDDLDALKRYVEATKP